jgi:hypothetical protein
MSKHFRQEEVVGKYFSAIHVCILFACAADFAPESCFDAICLYLQDEGVSASQGTVS